MTGSKRDPLGLARKGHPHTCPRCDSKDTHNRGYIYRTKDRKPYATTQRRSCSNCGRYFFGESCIADFTLDDCACTICTAGRLRRSEALKVWLTWDYAPEKIR